MEQSRFKSPVLWASLGSLVIGTLLTLDIIDLELSQELTNLITILLSVLGGFGVINNPTDKNNF